MILDPRVEVECDECGHFESFGLTPLARGAWDDRDLEKQIERLGWKSIGGDEYLCYDCANSPFLAQPL